MAVKGARRLAVIGAGRCAATVARALQLAGYEVAAVTCRGSDSAAAAAEMLGGAPVATSNAAAALSAPLVLIGVPDRAIEPVAAELARAGGEAAWRGRVVLHLSGALDAGALRPLGERGAAVGSLHPLQTFPERVAEPAYLKGIAFAVEGDAEAVAAGAEAVAALEGRMLRLAPGAKAVYHAGAAVASNHLHALLDLATGLLVRAGAGDAATARSALFPLALASLAAFDEQGPQRALTGPIVRGDDGTVARHLAALAPDEREAYACGARATLALARRSGRLAAADAETLALRLEPPGRRRARVLSLRGETLEEMAEKASRGRDLAERIEFRLDWLVPGTAVRPEQLDPAHILPVRAGTAATRALAQAFLARRAGDAGAFVDLPLGEEDGFPRERLILSWHGPAEGAVAAARAIAHRRPRVGKVVVEAVRERDLLAVPAAAAELRRGVPLVACFASGVAGEPTRILHEAFGSDWTYVALAEDQRTAPGQLAAGELASRYRWRERPGAGEWNAAPVWGLAGSPIGHSLSPLVFNRLLPGIYAPFPSLDLEATLALLSGHTDFRGLSVTMPLKEAAARLVATRSPEAGRAGSVNTILATPSGLAGHNTDVDGIAEAACELLALDGATALVLGSGGSARAAVVGLMGRGARVVLASRRPGKARETAEGLGAGWTERTSEVKWDLLVNATPVGMGDDAESIPIDPSELTGRAVVDLVYEPRRTRLVIEARARGLAAAPGLEVFLRQARRQAELFLGTAVALERIRELAGR